MDFFVEEMRLTPLEEENDDDRRALARSLDHLYIRPYVRPTDRPSICAFVRPTDRSPARLLVGPSYISYEVKNETHARTLEIHLTRCFDDCS